LPFPLTHAQIASAIGTTRVTVTRLMKELREERKSILIKDDNLICLLSSANEQDIVTGFTT
jgi:CRP-like cAMP-binding protein